MTSEMPVITEIAWLITMPVTTKVVRVIASGKGISTTKSRETLSKSLREK